MSPPIVNLSLLLSLLPLATGADIGSCLPGPVDVAFAIESSDSIGRTNFEKIKAAVSQLSSQFDVGPRIDQSHIGLSSFNAAGSLEFGVSEYLAIGAVQKAISRAAFKGGACNIADGAKYALEQVLKTTTNSESSRRFLPKVLIVVTDGKESSEPAAVYELAKKLKVTIIAVGIGPGVSKFQLTELAGNEKFVIIAPSFDELSIAFGSTCQLIEKSIAPHLVANTPRQCPCTLEHLWLDIVFVVDTANAVGDQDFNTIKSFISTFLETVTISQDQGETQRPTRATRVAFVAANKEPTRYGDLKTYKNNDEAIAALDKIQFGGGNFVNIRSALVEAKEIFEQSDDRRSEQNVVVYIGTSGWDCSTERQKLILKDKALAANDPCTTAEQMQSSGIILMTIAMRLPGMEFPPFMDFGSPCFRITNDADMADKFIEKVCKANCHCLSPLTQFTGDDECEEYGECVFKQTIPTGFFAARIGCQMEHQSLADVLSEKKQKFLNDLAKQGGSFPYWIGAKREQNGVMVWDFEAKTAVKEDYHPWQKGAQNAGEECASTVQMEDGSTVWQHEKCSWDEPSYFYFCQQKTCDTDNYC